MYMQKNKSNALNRGKYFEFILQILNHFID